MQKKIIVLAIASALTAPALAFADTTVYGILDAGYSSTSTTLSALAGGDTKTGIAAYGFSTMTSSRLGFTATEDMGGGMKAMVKIETGIGSNANAGAAASPTATPTPAPGNQATNGTTIDATLLGSRELNASVMMDATTVKLGFGSTMIRDISLGYAPDPGGNLVGNILNADATNLSSNRATGLTVTQGFDKLTGTVQLTARTRTADNTADEKNANGYLLGAQYADGPISVAGAYQNQKFTTTAVLNPVTLTETTRKIFILGGSYDLQVAKLIAEYASVKSDQTVVPVNNAKNSYFSFGAQVPVGDKILAFAQISTGKVNRGTATAVDQTLKGFTVGGKYNMAKTTYAYASVGNIKLDVQSGFNNGYKVDQFALGLVRIF